jgi:hypothetical protein
MEKKYNVLGEVVPDDDVYAAFNKFIFSNDVRVIGKLLQRFMFFQKIRHMPGDIVELGVFKGSGLATWSKFIELTSTYSNRKVLGFDLFDAGNKVMDGFEHGDKMQIVYDRVSHADLSVEKVESSLKGMNLAIDRHILIKGDVIHTTKQFATENPGARISLLYIDVDLCEPTYHGLKNLWDKIVPGGYIVFDEYEYHKFDESNGVDKFLKEFGIPYKIRTTDSLGPTAYMIKE